MRVFVDAVKTGFVTGCEGNGARIVDQPTECEGGAERRDRRWFPIQADPRRCISLSMSAVSIRRRRCMRQRAATMSLHQNFFSRGAGMISNISVIVARTFVVPATPGLDHLAVGRFLHERRDEGHAPAARNRE